MKILKIAIFSLGIIFYLWDIFCYWKACRRNGRKFKFSYKVRYQLLWVVIFGVIIGDILTD